jgi:hypothetical protein
MSTTIKIMVLRAELLTHLIFYLHRMIGAKLATKANKSHTYPWLNSPELIRKAARLITPRLGPSRGAHVGNQPRQRCAAEDGFPFP